MPGPCGTELIIFIRPKSSATASMPTGWRRKLGTLLGSRSGPFGPFLLHALPQTPESSR
jgi:hypothetical protein